MFRRLVIKKDFADNLNRVKLGPETETAITTHLIEAQAAIVDSENENRMMIAKMEAQLHRAFADEQSPEERRRL